MYTVMRANPMIAKVNANFDPCGRLPSDKRKHMMSKPR